MPRTSRSRTNPADAPECPQADPVSPSLQDASSPAAESSEPARSSESGHAPSAADAEASAKRANDPFGIATDYEAGVRLLESRQFRQVQLAFADKPSASVLELVKQHGFHWHPGDQVWVKQLSAETARRPGPNRASAAVRRSP